MPACEVTDAHVAVWNALKPRRGRVAPLFRELLPLLNIEAMYSFVVYKEVLYRRASSPARSRGRRARRPSTRPPAASST